MPAHNVHQLAACGLCIVRLVVVEIEQKFPLREEQNRRVLLVVIGWTANADPESDNAMSEDWSRVRFPCCVFKGGSL